MASCTGSLTHFGTDPSSWTVEKLKEFLRQRNLPLTGRKNELVVRVLDFMETEELELEIDATSFKELNVESAISFMELPDSDWATTGLPEVDENIACTYLKRLSDRNAVQSMLHTSLGGNSDTRARYNQKSFVG